MRPPNKEAFSKNLKLLRLHACCSKVLEKRPYHSYVIQGKFKVMLHAFLEKVLKSPSLFGDWRHQLKF